MVEHIRIRLGRYNFTCLSGKRINGWVAQDKPLSLQLSFLLKCSCSIINREGFNAQKSDAFTKHSCSFCLCFAFVHTVNMLVRVYTVALAAHCLWWLGLWQCKDVSKPARDGQGLQQKASKFQQHNKAHSSSPPSTLPTQHTVQSSPLPRLLASMASTPAPRMATPPTGLLFQFMLVLLSIVYTYAQESKNDRLYPSSEVVGGIILALGLILAFGGKNVMSLYCAAAGFLFGVFVSYVALERIQVSNDMGPNKDIIELVCALLMGLIGAALGLCLSRFAVFLMAVLFGLVVTVALLTIPGTENFRSRLPVWGLALIVCAISIVIYALLEAWLVIVFTALVGSFAFACGLDAILKTGFNEEVSTVLTQSGGPDSVPFEGTEDMLPIVYAFCGCLVLGSITQVCVSRRTGGGRDGDEARKLRMRRNRAYEEEEEEKMENGGTVAHVY